MSEWEELQEHLDAHPPNVTRFNKRRMWLYEQLVAAVPWLVDGMQALAFRYTGSNSDIEVWDLHPDGFAFIDSINLEQFFRQYECGRYA